MNVTILYCRVGKGAGFTWSLQYSTSLPREKIAQLSSADAGAVASGVVSASGAKPVVGGRICLDLTYVISRPSPSREGVQLRLMKSASESRSARRYGECRDAAVLCTGSSPVSPKDVLLHCDHSPSGKKFRGDRAWASRA